MEQRESIINKIAISAVTNRRIGGQAPSKYLPRLQQEAETTAGELRRRVEQHHIDYEALAADDFDSSFEARRKSLLELIAAAMGKAVSDTRTPTLPEDYDLEDEEPADEDVIEAEAAA